MKVRFVALLAALVAPVACAAPSSSTPKPQPPPQQPPPYGYGYPPPQQYPPQQYPPQQYPPQQYPPQQAPPQQPPPQQPPQGRPLLPPLVGPAAWQGESRAILAELVAALPAASAARVRGIPLVFDPNPNEVNAFAGCDDRGAPFIAGTEGLLEAVDAISQTRATDELYGTQTYDQYTSTVLPQLVQSDRASPALPMGIVPANVALDPRRISRAHEIFDNIIAFTFGHELGHHYLGHTGCANGQPMTGGPSIAALGNILTNVLPGLNQGNEVAADGAGCINTLDAGKARMPQYRWTEAGGLLLLDYFARLDRAGGISPLNPVNFLRSHPNPAARIPAVQAVAFTWRLQHPG